MVDSPPEIDLDPLETQEWQDALSAVIEREGQELSLIHISEPTRPY